MILDKRVLLAFTLSSWAALTMLGKLRKHNRHQEHKAHKEELKKWEGEGGNLPPSIY